MHRNRWAREGKSEKCLSFCAGVMDQRCALAQYALLCRRSLLYQLLCVHTACGWGLRAVQTVASLLLKMQARTTLRITSAHTHTHPDACSTVRALSPWLSPQMVAHCTLPPGTPASGSAPSSIYFIGDPAPAGAAKHHNRSIWDAASGHSKQPVCKGSLEGHTDWVNDVALLEDRVLSCSNDKTVRVWHGETGEVHGDDGRCTGRRRNVGPVTGNMHTAACAHSNPFHPRVSSASSDHGAPPVLLCREIVKHPGTSQRLRDQHCSWSRKSVGSLGGSARRAVPD
eukprot:220318-Pelagomonas_calceolata.AAC.7